MRKVVYFATGAPEQAAADLTRLRARNDDPRVRVVVLREVAPELQQRTSLPAEQILPYSGSSIVLLWMRLCLFLAFSLDSEVICFKSPGQFRALKLLALALPGKLIVCDGQGVRLSCSRLRLLWAAAVEAIEGKGPVCVVGAASAGHLKNLLPALRARFPGARLHGVLSNHTNEPTIAELFDNFQCAQWWFVIYVRLLAGCVGKGRFRAIVFPFSKEHRSGLKWLAWLLPIWRAEIYNQNLDSFSARNPLSLVRDWMWRTRESIDRWRCSIDRRRHSRELRRRQTPVGVIGTASGLYLKKIVPAVRARFPEARVHGLVPAATEGPARGLFDATAILQPSLGGLIRQCWRATRQRCQCWIVPCTDEPYAGIKLLAFLLPFGPRYIYNEEADGFPVRDLRMLCRHLAWRLRDRLSFQIFAGAAGGNLGERALHLFLYSLRLLGGAVLLGRVRLRTYWRGHARWRLQPSDGTASSVDVIYLDSAGGDSLERPPLDRSRARINSVMTVSKRSPTEELLHTVNGAIRKSRADFICIIDSECRIHEEDWLDRLLESCDERTAQVGPQIVSSTDGSIMRGGLLGAQGPQWNADNAVCWRSRPEWLLVDALPWICIVIRRGALLDAGLFDECRDDTAGSSDPNFCHRLAARGWQSICNQSVSAYYPVRINTTELAPAVGAGREFGFSEDRT